MTFPGYADNWSVPILGDGSANVRYDASVFATGVGKPMITDEQYAGLLDTRARYPSELSQATANRIPGPAVALLDRMLIVAIDHPARRILGVGEDPFAMADRRDLLNRTMIALSRPGVHGLLATPDIIEDLMLLDALDRKLIFGSMNRGGLTGSAWELNDPMTAYTAQALAARKFDGGKMLLRLDYDDPGTRVTLEACARAVGELADENLIALVEPLPARRNIAARVELDLSADAMVEAVAVASALGHTSRYTWLKLPVIDDMDRMMAATTLPTLLLGGDPGDNPQPLFAQWKAALEIPNVRGLVAGRSLLYPHDGNVERAVDAAAEMVNKS